MIGFVIIYSLWMIILTILGAIAWSLLPESKFISWKARFILSGVASFLTYIVVGFRLI